MPELREIPLSKVVFADDFNTRHQLGDLRDLTASIEAVGVKEPVLVKDMETGGEYEIFAGFRRLEASKLAKCKSIPAIVHTKKSVPPKMMLILNVVENIQREDLNPMDEARAFQKLHKEHKMSLDDIVAKVGIRKKRLTQRLRLLKMGAVIQEAILEERITPSAALEIDRLPKDKQAKYVHVAEDLNRLKLKNLVDKELEKLNKQVMGDDAEPAEKPAVDPVTALVRSIRKNSQTVCSGLGYDEEHRQGVKDVNFRLLEPDDVVVVDELLSDLATLVPEDVDFNDKAEKEIIGSVEDGIMTLDRESPIVRQVLIGAIKSRSQQMAEDRSTSSRRPKVTYAIAQEAIAEFFAKE